MKDRASLEVRIERVEAEVRRMEDTLEEIARLLGLDRGPRKGEEDPAMFAA